MSTATPTQLTALQINALRWIDTAEPFAKSRDSITDIATLHGKQSHLSLSPADWQAIEPFLEMTSHAGQLFDVNAAGRAILKDTDMLSVLRAIHRRTQDRYDGQSSASIVTDIEQISAEAIAYAEGR